MGIRLTKTKHKLGQLDENFQLIEENKYDPAAALKKGFLIRTLKPENYRILRKMGNTDYSITKWQKKRLTLAILFGVIFGFMMKFFVSSAILAFLIGIGIGIGFYYIQGRSITNMYTAYQFRRQLQFAKFTRILTPFLKELSTGRSLYTMFAKVMDRLDEEEDKRLLRKLMKDMSDNPQSVKPFTEFADNFSGSDSALVFMSAVYDMKTGATDDEVVDELSKEANEELILKIREIRKFKKSKFGMFPTFITITALFVLGGEIVGLMLSAFSGIKF